jgi:hypothetical protein
MNTIKKKKQNFTIVGNGILRDNRLSFKAKGLFCYMYSMDDGWSFTIKSIATQQKDGVDSIRSALNELKELGYIEYKKYSDGRGEYFLYDEPNLENQDLDNPNSENPNLENPNMGKSNRIKNTNYTKNTNYKNKEKINKKEKLKKLLLEAFKNKKILALKDKINLSKCLDALKEIKEEELEQIASDYALYVQANKKLASRLDKYLWAYIAKDMSLVNYADANKPQVSKKTKEQEWKEYEEWKNSLFSQAYQDTEIIERGAQ